MLQPKQGHHNAALQAMEKKIDELPLLPQALVKLLQLDHTEDNFFDDFERLTQEDPAFAVRVIGIANSSAYAPVSPITTIRDAVTRMGAATIAKLVASLAVQRVFMPTEAGQVRLWTHSIMVACSAEEIAKITPSLGVSPNEAYLAGLLHDIGRFLMLEHAPEELRAVDESKWNSPEQLIAADVDIYKFTHCELGYIACERWGIPNTIANLVRDHHTELDQDIEPASVDANNLCVQVADRLTMYVLEGSGDMEITQNYVEDNVLNIPGSRYVDAKNLMSRLPAIKDWSQSLVNGLGLTVQQ